MKDLFVAYRGPYVKDVRVESDGGECRVWGQRIIARDLRVLEEPGSEEESLQRPGRSVRRGMKKESCTTVASTRVDGQTSLQITT